MFRLGPLVALTTVLTAQAPQKAPFVLPAPTGPHAVGVTSWIVTDPSRDEPFAPGQRRQVLVNAWYPAEQRGGRGPAPYLIEGTAGASTLSALVGRPGSYDALANVATHSQVDAPPAPVPERLPLLLFSHGYIGSPSAHTALVEELASHSYLVLSIVHPYEATAATLANGSTVTPLDESGALRPLISGVLDEWAREDDRLARVTKAAAEDDQRRLLREYLARLANTDAALTRWVDDTRLVLDSLSETGQGTTRAILAARVDLTRVAALGHSLGGVTAAQFCLDDHRCRAALNLDGIPQYGSMIDGNMAKPFLMMYSARPGRLGASDAIYRRAAAPYFRVDVRDTLHLDFTDMPFWGGPMHERGAFGALPPSRSTAITRAVVREFFDLVLFGTASPVLSGARVFPEVEVWTAR